MPEPIWSGNLAGAHRGLGAELVTLGSVSPSASTKKCPVWRALGLDTYRRESNSCNFSNVCGIPLLLSGSDHRPPLPQHFRRTISVRMYMFSHRRINRVP
jgi:hypothetical protein